MSGINAYLKNAVLAGNGLVPIPTNNPQQYADRQRQYFDPETRRFIQDRARFASDFMVAQVQGLNEADPQAWDTYRIRLTNIVRPSAAIQRHFDDYKQFLFESEKIEYVRPGTKIQTMGNTWLVVNPDNISGASGSGMVRRCNAVWNFLDYYGNVISEPIIVENSRANANDSDAQNSQLISKGYFNVTCQYNDWTRQIDTNTRMILGTGAYRVTGYSDFEMEFTGDYDSVRLLSFSVRYEEPNDAIDDMVNHVAGGKTFSWTVKSTGETSLAVGATAQMSAQSIRNGVYVTGTTAQPIRYLWSSSDESVAEVDADGEVTAIAEGHAVITATLEQNPAWSAPLSILVTQSIDGVRFTTTTPEQLGAYESTTITAAYFDNGAEQSDPLTWSFTGAEATAYRAVVTPDGKSANITCFGYSETPLTVNVSYGTYYAGATIGLEGI